MKIKILYIIILLSAFIVSAQQPVSVNLTEKDGVPGTDFYDIIEDDKGYIWLDGNKGIYRYDGKYFKKFQHKEQRGLSVFQVKKDFNNIIWYVNLSGQVFNIENEKVSLFKDLKSVFKGSLPTLNVYKNYLVLFTSNILLIYNKNTKQEVYSYFSQEILDIEPFFKNNKVFFGNTSNIIQVDINNFEVENNHIGIDKSLSNSSFPVFINDKLIMLLRANNNIESYKFSLNFKQKFVLKNDLPNVQFVKAKVINKQIWYCTSGGVFICEVDNNNLVTKRHLFKNKFITDIVVDKEENYWFTTINNSIIVVPNIEINKVTNFIDRDVLINKTYLGNKDELILTTSKLDVIRLNTNTFKTKTVSYKKDNKILIANYNAFNNEYVVATNAKTYKYDRNFKLIETLPYLGHVKKLHYLDNDYALASFSKYFRILKYPTFKKEYLFELNGRGYAVYYDTINDLRYFSTIDGLFVMDKTLKPHKILYENKPIYISSITQTKDGIIWCSSFKDGVFSINNETVIKHFTINNGLLSNIISKIKSDNNALWILGDKGVQKYNTQNNTFQNITKNEGVISYNYTGLEIIDNNVYISTPNQLIYFDKKNVFKSYNTKEFYFTDVIIDHKKEPLKNNYTFSYDKSNIKINFNAIGFNAKDKARFKYRLKGIDNNWSETNTGENYIMYNALNSGNYTLQVQNITSDKSKIITKEITLTVTKPFWLKWWFYITLASLVLIVIRIRTIQKVKLNDKIRKKELKALEIEKQLVNLKLENFRSQMNPHFIFNALNSIQDYIITNNKNLAADYLGKFAGLIRIYLSQSTQDTITLQEEITTLNQYLELEKMRFEKSFNYKLIIKPNIETKEIKIPTMLIQPYVENAIKHGLLHIKGEKQLTITFSKKEDKLKCIVEDNGIGRAKSTIIQNKRAKKHKSFATKANRVRLDLLNLEKNDQIEIKTIDLTTNGEPTGTKVIIYSPLNMR